jgi:hypothetical protein
MDEDNIRLVVIFFAIGTCILVFTYCGRTYDSRETAEANAKRWLAEMHIEYKGVSCAKRDTDGDGYVSCTASVEKSGAPHLMPLECAGNVSFNDGCRVPRRVMINE